jgi:hypothetical protein
MTIALRSTICLLAVLALAGCQAPAPVVAARTSTPSPSPTPATVREFTTCFTAAPATWAGARRASLPATRFGVVTVTPAGDRAYGYSFTAAGDQAITALDLHTGALTTIIPSADGPTLAVDPPWLAWVEAMSPENPGTWTLRARNLDTGQQLTLGGGDLHVPISVVVNAGRVAWAQFSPAGTGQVLVYDLAARSQTVLDSGDVGGPVLAGRYLVWSRAGAGLRAVDAATLRPVQLPDRVRGQPAVAYLAGSPDELVWSTDPQHAVAWRIDRDQLSTYAIRGVENGLQFLTVAGHFLIWSTVVQVAVLDLDTGGGYDIAGSVAGSDVAIVRTEPLGTINGKLGAPGTTVSVLPTASAPAIPGCGR